jgi:hypothetical protein
MATEHEIGVNVQFSGNSLLNMGEESISPNSIISPPSFAVNQNDYAPTGIQVASVIRLTSSAVVNVTGIVAPDTARWKKLIIFNVGGSNIILADASASSLAANRFAVNGNLILNANEGVYFLYDQTSLRWRCIGKAI